MKFLFYIFTFIILFSGCGSSSNVDNQKKHTLKSLSVDNIEVASTITLKLTNSDKIQSYTWRNEDGTFLGHNPTLEWTAPIKEGRYLVSVDTVDINEKKSTTSIAIKVVQSSYSNGRPKISLIGEKSIELPFGEIYEERGATSYDEEDGDLTDDIIISGEVDIYTSGRYIITYSSTDSDGRTTVISRVITVIKTYLGPFSKIKKLISDSNNGTLSDVTYICVGDSTRAISVHDGQHLFNEIKNTLYRYNVTSKLLARAGHTAKEFNLAQNDPTYKDVIDSIDGDGSHAIVSISLGINDYWKKFNFKSNIKSSILKIRRKKPKTNFILTVPNRVYNDRGMTYNLREEYISLSKELNIPLIDVVEDVMPTQLLTQKSWYINDGFNVHLTKEGQHLVAQDILSKILP